MSFDDLAPPLPHENALQNLLGTPNLADKLLAVSPTPILVLEMPTATILTANTASQAFFGMGQSSLTGRKFAECFWHVEEGQKILDAQLRYVALQYLVLGTGQHTPVELHFRKLDDTDVTLVYIRDLKRQSAQDNQLRIAERNHRLIFENSPQPMILLDRHFNVVSANLAATTLYGLTNSDSPQVNLKSILVNPHDLALYRVKLEPETLAPQWHWRTDGTQRLIEASISPMLRERKSFVLVALHDVTQGQQQINELRQAEERWRFALEGHGDGVWEWFPESGESIVSDRFLEILGFAQEDARRAFDYWDARVHPDDYLRMHLAVMQHFLAESSMINGEYRMMTIDGQYRWLAIRARAIEVDTNGRAKRMIGTVRDIHDQRRQEQRERLQQEQLMHTARLASMGELVTMIAHEVTQPLTAISNYAAVARRHLERLNHLPELGDAAHALGRIGDQVGQAGEVVHRIRSFVRKSELKLERISVNILLSDVARLAEIQARALSAEIELDLAIGLPEITGDRMQLGQMLLNLARNGLESMASVDGPRRLKMRSKLNTQSEIELEVEDGGCGLVNALALDVITPFFTTKPEGLGMGLSICKTVVENHQGRLWSSAVKPAGTIFHVSLPVSE